MHLAHLATLWLAAAQAPVDEGRAIIERAVAAQGGLELLTRPATSFSRVKGNFHGTVEFTGAIHNGGAGKLRLALDFKDQGSRLVILNGAKGWLQFDGVTQEMNKDSLDRNLRARYVDRVCGLVSLLRDKGYTFTPLGESSVEGKTAVGVKVTSEGNPEVRLYFEKDTGLLAKSSFRGIDANSNRDASMEAYYRDYHLIDNTAEAEKVLLDARRTIDNGALLAYLRDNIPVSDTRVEVQTLIAKLGDASFAVRQEASNKLVRHGIKAGALLRRALSNRDVEVSRRAAACLDSLELECRLAASVARLAGLRRIATPEALLSYLPWAPNEMVTREVEDALFGMIRGEVKGDPYWAKAMDSDDRRVRQIAAAALGKDDAFLKQPGHRLFIDGVRLPRSSSTTVDGQKRLDMETLERSYFNRFEDSLFEEPVQVR